ncbi:uncharacterized protein LOC128222935 isoform X2 [Mya arenaria]|uniref:uncharacterized protein LOC128222935 isoform X2 n=1 Tax=Mya arenaria TaxID=6604 RepID=UPI0022E5A75E|nr:uncharacterized protein LOC128222935 isoform X2 [Mya arenaria]
MHDKLDLVSILERVRCRNEKMKIIHRMPRKFFLSDELESIETNNMSYFDINGIIRCCFFGSKHFDDADADDLHGIEKDRAHVHEMSNEFVYTSYPLDNDRKAKEAFKFQLTKKEDTGCHMFVFSSHGDSEGLFTSQTDNKVKFIDLIKIVRALEKNLPVVLVFDCCRIENKGYFGKSLSVSNKLLQMRNIIVVYAAVEGYTSTMFETTGSVLIKTMFEVIEKHRLKSDFLTMMECVNRTICEPCENDYTGWNLQTCVEIDSQLEKKLFLFETETATINANEQEQKETETVAFYAQATGQQEPRQEDEPINIGVQGLVMQPGQIKRRRSV